MTRILSSALVAVALSACGDGSTEPLPPTGADLAAEFTAIAQAAERNGDLETAFVSRSAAQLARSVAEITALEVEIDRRRHRYYGIAVQITMPEVMCEDLPPDVICESPFGDGFRLLVAVNGRPIERMLVAIGDLSGSSQLDQLPEDEFGFGAVALLLDRAADRVWISTSGSLTTTEDARGGACPAPAAPPPGIEYDCERGRLGFALDMRAEEFVFGGTPSAITVRVAPQSVSALFLDVTSIDVSSGPSMPLGALVGARSLLP